MTRLETELRHMLEFLSDSPTSFRGFRQYFEHKAKTLAESEPAQYSQLPSMLAAEIARLRLKHSQSQQPTKDTR